MRTWATNKAYSRIAGNKVFGPVDVVLISVPDIPFPRQRRVYNFKANNGPYQLQNKVIN